MSKLRKILLAATALILIAPAALPQPINTYVLTAAKIATALGYTPASNATCTSTTSGLVPTPPNNTTTFLRGDCSFAAPASAPVSSVFSRVGAVVAAANDYAITQISGLGTGIATALGINAGTSGSVVVNGDVLGTPSSGVGTNITNVNAASLGGATFAAPGAIGGGTPATGAFTTATASLSHRTSAALPTISSCGASPPAATAGSSNNAGQFTTGTGAPTGCTITFANAYPNSAFCTLTPANAAALAGAAYILAAGSTGLSVAFGPTSTGIFNYNCSGN